MRPSPLVLLLATVVAACQPDGADLADAIDDVDLGDAAAPLTAGVLPSTLRVAVVPYNFADADAPPLAFTTAQLRNLVFDGTGSDWATASLRSYFQEITENRMTLAGDVYQPVILPYSRFASDGRLRVVTVDLLPDLDRLAGQQGFVRSSYDVVIYTAPYAEIRGVYKGGGVIFAELVTRTRSLGVYAHEVGHALGLSHANTYTCGAPGYYVAIGPASACTTQEYNDHTSVMGGSLPYHPSAYEKLALGVWGASQVRDVTASGTYVLPALERAGVAGARVLRIPVKRTHVSPYPAYYYLSYRQPIGFDAPRAGGPWVQGISVHLALAYDQRFPEPLELGTWQRASRAQLVDATPATGGSFGDGAVLVGQTFRDPAEGLTIRVLGIDGQAATVQIDLGCRDARRITSSRAAINGTSAEMTMDRSEAPGLVTGYDDWQYVQLDTGAGCEIDVGALRRKMSPGSPVPFAGRSLQGEGVTYALTSTAFSWVDHGATSGWESYVAYAGHAWHSVGYGWSAWLRLATPIHARYLRFQWDGNGPGESLDELELY